METWFFIGSCNPRLAYAYTSCSLALEVVVADDTEDSEATKSDVADLILIGHKLATGTEERQEG